MVYSFLGKYDQKYFPTAKMFVSEVLKKAILKGEFKAGDPLPQDKIASVLGVSTLPVREALISLSNIGLVDNFPNKGAFVSSLRKEEMEEIFDIRIMLETGAIRRSIPNLKKEDFKFLYSLLERADSSKDMFDRREGDILFHEFLLKPSRMPRLLTLITQMHENVARYMLLYLYFVTEKPDPLDGHINILEKCEKGDIDGAVESLANHITLSKEALKRLMSVDYSCEMDSPSKEMISPHV